jgi:hypothetical protein
MTKISHQRTIHFLLTVLAVAIQVGVTSEVGINTSPFSDRYLFSLDHIKLFVSSITDQYSLNNSQ